MKTTREGVYQSSNTKATRTQRGFISIGLGLALTALFGTTSVIMATANETEGVGEEYSMPQPDIRPVRSISQRHCNEGKIEHIKVVTKKRGTRFYGRSGRTEKVCS